MEWELTDIRKYQDILCLEGRLLETAPEGWLTREEAIDIAVQHILATSETVYPQAWYGEKEPLPLTEDYVRGLSLVTIPAEGTEDGHDIWYLWFYEPDWMVPALDCFALRIDAHSGEVLYSTEPGGWG